LLQNRVDIHHGSAQPGYPDFFFISSAHRDRTTGCLLTDLRPAIRDPQL
jgi:hypothetical protein